MKRRLSFRTVVWAAFAAVALLSLTVGAGAVQGDKKFRMYDDCEPISFNAVLGDGTCIGNGKTTFAEFIAELEETQDVQNLAQSTHPGPTERWQADGNRKPWRRSSHVHQGSRVWRRLYS